MIDEDDNGNDDDNGDDNDNDCDNDVFLWWWCWWWRQICKVPLIGPGFLSILKVHLFDSYSACVSKFIFISYFD